MAKVTLRPRECGRALATGVAWSRLAEGGITVAFRAGMDSLLRGVIAEACDE